MSFVASLPMYDLPGLSRAMDDWWSGLASALRKEGVHDVPDRLTRGGPPEAAWLSEDLVFSQTCGYPFATRLRGQCQVVAIPSYSGIGCAPGRYCSAVLVREDDRAWSLEDLRGRTAAFNSRDSQSGYNAFRRMLAGVAGGRAFLSGTVESGSHLNSMRQVREGRADVCAVDIVTYTLAAKVEPRSAGGLRVLCRTPETPGLPFIAARALAREAALLPRLRAALVRALADPRLAEARDTLNLAGAVVASEEIYDVVLSAETEARTLDYPDIA